MIRSSRTSGFSLVEVTLAIGIVGFALLAIVGLIPVGLNSGREAIDATRTSLIAQDVVNRVRATMVSTVTTDARFLYREYTTAEASYFFYDSQGLRTGELLKVATTTDSPAFYSNVRNPGDFYRVKVTIGVFDQTASFPPYDPRHQVPGTTPGLLSGILEVAWPVNQADGSVPAAAVRPPVRHTFFVRKP